MYLFAIIGLGLIHSCLAQGRAHIRSVPVLPSDDSFYLSPRNFSAYYPGEIIASRTVSTDLNGFLGVSLTSISLAAAYQFLYRTSDSLQNPVAAVTTVLVPHNAQPGKLLSYQTAYDSANINCSPSYSLQAGANNTAVVDIVVMTAALNKGYYVVSADYEGLNAAFTSGRQAGYATLDSVRVALSTASRLLTGLSADPRCVLWGYSGGSIASEWAAELQPTYAPELHFEGVALGGLIGNISNVIVSIDKSRYAGLGCSGIQGLSNGFPELASLIESSFVSPVKQAQFSSIAQGCLLQALADGAGQSFSSYFTDFGSLLHDPLVQTILNETGQMGQTGVPNMPIDIYKPVGDDQIEYRRNLIGEHNSESILGSGSALEWIGDRLEGKSASTGYTVEDVFITDLDLGLVASFGLELYTPFLRISLVVRLVQSFLDKMECNFEVSSLAAT